jgi:acetyl-CoA synthetase
MLPDSLTTDSFPFHQEIVWQPNPAWMAQSNLRHFMDQHQIWDYDELLRRSTEDIGWFWDALLHALDVQFYQPYQQIVDLSSGLPFPRWCVGGKLNIIHNCLDKWQSTPVRNRAALRWEGEEGTRCTLTYGDLHQEVCRCANALHSLGLGQGDVVALYLPMIPELAVAFLAVIKLGGIVLPLFSGFGPAPIIARLQDAEAKAIITADGLWRRGKVSPMKPVLDEVLVETPSVKHTVVVQRIGKGAAKSADVGLMGQWTPGRDYWWHELVPPQAPTAETVQTAAEDVLMLIYTSGTTGKPKGAVHTHCGFAIKAAQDMQHCMDLKPEDTLYWVTDIGWMMGPWLILGALLNGASMVFYDGAPDYPAANRLWALVEQHHVTHLGVSPTLIRNLRSHGAEPVTRHDLTSLRLVASTGSPWDPGSWLWLFETVLQRQKPLINYSGGTECSGGILCSNLFKPIKPCSFAGPIPGMDVDVVNDEGKSVRNSVGELVIRQPWIGMTRGFWRDQQRYLNTYWNRFPNVWVHGDFALVDEDGLWYILGRSDDTIKVAGKRLGPAEVEAILNTHPAVLESAVVGAPHPIKDQEVVGFCVLKADYRPNEMLRQELIDLVTAALGKPLKPREIKFATALPKTRNAKVMHRLIRAAYLGGALGDLSSLENPSAVDAIRLAV